MKHKIGFMQGRLSDPVDGQIQSFPWKNWEEEFQTARSIDIALMEWTLDDLKLFQNPLMTNQGIFRIQSLSKKFNLKIKSLTGDCFMQKPFWKLNSPIADLYKNKFIKVCESSSRLGIEIIVIPLVDNGSLENNIQEDDLVDYLIEFAPSLNKLNLKLAFESDFEPKKLAGFINRFPSNRFGINYDTGNSASLGFDPLEEFKEYGKHIINVHIKDRQFGGTTVPLNKGDVNFDLIFKGLKDLNYKGNFILQTARAKDGKHSNIIKEYKEFLLTKLLL